MPRGGSSFPTAQELHLREPSLVDFATPRAGLLATAGGVLLSTRDAPCLALRRAARWPPSPPGSASPRIDSDAGRLYRVRAMEQGSSQHRLRPSLRRTLGLCGLGAAAILAAGGPVVGAGAPSGVREVRLLVGTPPLRGTLTLPAGRGPFPAAVMLPGSGPTDQDETAGANKPFRDIARGLAARGVASLRFDKRLRDYPKSIDPLTATAVEEYVPDALAAVRLLRRRAGIDAGRIFVLGHSMGGSFAPLVAKRAGRQVAGVVLLAASSEPFGAMILRQLRYLATLPEPIGSQARAQLPQTEQIAPLLDSPELARQDPGKVIYQGLGPAYFLSLQRYDGVATARSISQPILILQGDRDYQVTVRDDLVLWQRGLALRPHVKVVRFPRADHLFFDGSGPSNPLDYVKPAHVDPRVASTVAGWIGSIERAAAAAR